MGKSSPSPPATPDPYATASAQGTSNANTATAQTALNNANTYTPYGQTTYTVTGSQEITNPDGTKTSVPTYSVRQDLSGTQQAILNQNQTLEQMGNQIAGHALSSIGQTMANPLSSDQFGQIQTSAGATPTLKTGYDSAYNLQSYDPGGTIQTSYSTGQPLQYGYDAGGNVQRDVSLNTNAPTEFGNTSTAVQTSLGNTDFTADRDAATNAALARLQPTTDRANANLQARLANQGVTAGSSAYNAANLQQAQQNNDLALGAVATGDAEQQALFGERLSSGQFANAAQQQEYAQALGRGQFAQAGIAQNNAATLDMGQFHNAAQAQQNQENAAAAAFHNATAGQDNAQNAALAMFGNNAQAQQNAQNAAQAAFYNQGVNTNNANNAAQAAFYNAASDQGYQDRLTGAQFSNQAIAQQLQQAMALQNQQINQVSALRSGSQVQLPASQGYQAATLDQTPLSSDVYQSAALQNQQYQAQLQASAQNQAAMGSALGGIFGGIGRKSDRRLKSDVSRIATARNGLPIYRYRLAGADGWHLGFMADEVALIHPDAVWTDADDGWARVDYDRAVA